MPLPLDPSGRPDRDTPDLPLGAGVGSRSDVASDGADSSTRWARRNDAAPTAYRVGRHHAEPVEPADGTDRFSWPPATVPEPWARSTTTATPPAGTGSTGPAAGVPDAAPGASAAPVPDAPGAGWERAAAEDPVAGVSAPVFGPGDGSGPAPGAGTAAFPGLAVGPDADPASAGPDSGGTSATDVPAPPTGTGRAGRNLPAAIGVGLVLGAVILVSILVWKPAFLILVIAAGAVATWEMTRAVHASGARPPLVPLLLGGPVMAGLAWWGGPETLLLGLVATVLAALVWRLADGPVGFQRDAAAIALIAVYIPFLAGFAVLLARPAEDGAIRILAMFVGVVLSDTGGYAAGVFLGRHPMAPSVSPKKSWEGFAGSVVSASIGCAVLLYLAMDLPLLAGAVFGVAVACAAVLGDLAESLIKRDLGIKDMSDLLPGHGGLMDRLDSILFALPTAFAVLMLVAPVTG